MSTIRDALDNLAAKVGVADAAANDLTIADKIDTITAAIAILFFSSVGLNHASGR